MKLNFLWDEEKTRSLHKFQIILFGVGAIFVSLYGFSLPLTYPYRLVITTVPLILITVAVFNFFSINKPNQGIRLLVLAVIAQIIAIICMTVTGNLSSVLLFAPFAVLYVTLFFLGTAATMILWIISLVTLIACQFWVAVYIPQSVSLAKFLLYTGCFTVAAFGQLKIGQQLSLQFEAKKKLEQIDDLKNQFITLSSHYLRTPITITKSYLNQLKEPNLDEKQKNHLVKTIENSTANLDALVEKFLAIASIERGQAKIVPTTSDLNKLINELIVNFENSAKQKELTLVYEPPTQSLPIFTFDRIKIKEALSNVIDNAIKFNKERGSVVVKLSQVGNNAVVQISDTGPGIKKEHLESLFTTFNKGTMEKALQTDERGIGLGLYLAKLIIEAHKGKITVESAVDKGSTFTIIIPIK